MTFTIGQPLVEREPGAAPPETTAKKDPWADRLADQPSAVGPPWTDTVPADAVGKVCDVCAAADLSERGIMPTSLTPDQLHATCRYPGSCTCGCERSRSAACVNCGRLIPPSADVRFQGGTGAPECLDRDSCAAAMLERASAAKDLTKPKKAAPAPSRASSAPRPPVPPREPRIPKATGGPCNCRCGQITGGGKYKPGHDAKHLSALLSRVQGGGSLEEALAELPSDALKAKLTKRLEAS